MSSKMSSKRQIKRSKEKRNQDKMDKAMNDVKKIGIISCCLIAILLIIGVFISPKESYAAGFLTQLPKSFVSSVNTYNGGSAAPGNMHTLIGTLSLPWEFYSEEYTNQDGTIIKGKRLSFIYCVDRSKAMKSGVIYEKGPSVKTTIDLGNPQFSNSYPGLIYILLNDNIVQDGDANIPANDTANYVNYYITQVAIWYYIDKINGSYDNFSEEETTMIENDQTFYGKKVRELVNGALNYKINNNEEITNDILINQDEIIYNVTNNYVETNVIKPRSNNSSFESYSVQINSEDTNIQILDESGNIVTGIINANQGFKVRIPLDAINNNTLDLPITVVGYFANNYDANIYIPNDGNAQLALLGIVEKPSTPTTINLKAPTIPTPDTNSTSYLVYGLGALVIIAGIVLIVVAKRPKDAKKK